MDDLEEPKKEVILFGRDVSKIPCFRNSFLYGIGGGLGCGLATFMLTSRVRFATHVGFGSFMTTTMVYWVYCRYQWSQQKFAVSQLQSAMKKTALYEGTVKDPNRNK